MKSPLKIIAIALGALVALIVVAVLLAPVLLNPNSHKDRIAATVMEKTGRRIELPGTIEMTWFPWLGVKVPGVTLGNPAGFGDAPFAHADLIEARIKLMPLLRHDIEMDTIRVHGASVNLIENADGSNNWADLLKQEEEKEPFKINAFAIGGVDVKNVKVTYTSAKSGREARIGNLTAATGPLVSGAPIDLTLTFDAVTKKPALDGSFKLAGRIAYDSGGEHVKLEPLAVTGRYKGRNVPGGSAELSFGGAVDADLDAGTIKVAGLNLATLGASVQGTMTASRIKTDAPAMQAEIRAGGKDLALIFQVLEESALAKQIAAIDNRAFDLRAKIEADQETGKATLSDLSVDMVGATITGRIDAENIQTGKPAMKGSLKATGPDLPTLLRVAGQFQPGQARTLERMGKALANTTNKSFDINTRFEADRDKGTINVPELSAKLLGATIGGRLQGTDTHTDKPHVSGEISASGADLPALLIVAGYAGAEDAPGKGGKLQKPALARIGTNLAGAPGKAFTARTKFDADMKRGNIDVSELTAEGLGLKAQGRLKAAGFDSAKGTIDGRLSIQGTAVGPLLKAMDQAGLAEVVQSINAEAGISGNRADVALVPLNVKAVVAGRNIPNSPVTLTLGADARANLDKQTLALTNLALNGLGLDAKGQVNATNIKESPAFTGTLAIQPFDLRRLLAQLNQKIPVTADPAVLQRVAASAEFQGTPDSLDLRKLALTLDQTSASGNLKVTHFADPEIQFSLGVDGINADRYLAPKAKAPPGAPPPPPGANPPSKLPIETIRKLKLKGDLSIANLQYAGAKMSDVKLAVDSHGGRLNLDPAQAKLYMGSFRGKVGIDATGAQALMNVDSALSGVQLGMLLRDVAQVDKLDGAANLSLKVFGGGNDTDAIKRSLNGSGQFNVTNGVLRGVDARAALEQLELAIERKTIPQGLRGGETRFEQLGGTLNIQNGAVMNQDLQMIAPGVRATGRGLIANLVTRQVNYDLAVGVDKSRQTYAQQSYNLGGYTIPVRCRGTLSDPGCGPDYTEISKDLALKFGMDYLTTGRNPLQGLIGGKGTQPAVPGQAVPQQPQNIKDAARDAILRGLLGQ
ncbi:MAG: AsmA family protein [Gammaproteobacteria bacterium]